jgi:hypothetical protein
MFTRPIALLIALSLSAAGCSTKSGVACDKIYKECGVSLSSGGSQISAAQCEQLMAKAENQQVASCVVSSTCTNLTACLQGGGQPAQQPGQQPATGGGAQACSILYQQCGVQLAANGQPLSEADCARAASLPQNAQVTNCVLQATTCQQASGCIP